MSERWEALLLDLPMKAPIGTAVGTFRSRRLLVVHLATGEWQGWGECAALDEGTAVDAHLDDVVGNFALPMARAAFEMARLDADLRRTGESLAERWRVTPPASVGGLVGIPEDRSIETLLARVPARIERLRVKIEPGWDVEPLRALASALPAVVIQADANGSYAGCADRLAGLDGLGLGCIEQPLAPRDLEGHARLVRDMETPICLDESLTSIERLREAVEREALGVACIKPARLGGLEAGRRAGEICREAGIDAFVGGFFETSLARSANAVLAGCPGFTLPGDISDPSGYLVVDPFGGFGEDPDEAVLGEVLARRWDVSA